MNPAPDIEHHINQRIARLAPGRRDPTAHAELVAAEFLARAGRPKGATYRIRPRHLR